MSPLDPIEVEKKLDEHDKRIDDHEERLNKHDEKIHNLDTDFAVTEQRLIGIEGGQNEIKQDQNEMKHLFMNGNNLILTAYQTQSQELTKLMGIIIDSLKNQNNNETQLEVSKDKNNTNIILKVVGIIGGLVTAFFAGKSISG